MCSEGVSDVTYDMEDVDLPIPPPLYWFGVTDQEYELYLKWAYDDEELESEEEEVGQVAPKPKGVTGIFKKIRSWLFDPPAAVKMPLVLTEAIIEKSQRFEEACQDHQADLEEFIAEWQGIATRDRARMARKRTDHQFWLTLDWRAFEREVGYLYSDLGYDVNLTYPYGDGGVDLFLSRDGRVSVVQCKAHTKPIDQKDVEDLADVRRNDTLPIYIRSKAQRLGRSLRDYDEAILVSSSGFTEPAIWQSKMTRKMHLVSLADLVHLSQQAAANLTTGSEFGRFRVDPSPRCLVCGEFMIAHEDRWRCSGIRCRGWRAKRDIDS